MKRIFLLLITIVLFTKCNQKVFDSENHEDPINPVIENYEKSLIKLDSIVNNKQCSSIQLCYSDDDTCKLTLFYDAEKAYKLIYPQFDVVGDFVGYEAFYLNNGEAFAKIALNQSKKEISFFDLSKGVFYNNIYLINNSFQLDSTKEMRDLNRQCEEVKNIDALMHRFSSIGQYRVTPCLNDALDFKTIEDSVPMYTKPDVQSKVIRYLSKGEKIKYLSADKDNLEVNDFNSYFIKVRSENKIDSGWVFFTYHAIFSLDQEDGPEVQ